MASCISNKLVEGEDEEPLYCMCHPFVSHKHGIKLNMPHSHVVAFPSTWCIWCLLPVSNLYCKSELVAPWPTFQNHRGANNQPELRICLAVSQTWMLVKHPFLQSVGFHRDFQERSGFLWRGQYWDFYCHLERNRRWFMRQSCVVRRDFLKVFTVSNDLYVIHQMK